MLSVVDVALVLGGGGRICPFARQGDLFFFSRPLEMKIDIIFNRRRTQGVGDTFIWITIHT